MKTHLIEFINELADYDTRTEELEKLLDILDDFLKVNKNRDWLPPKNLIQLALFIINNDLYVTFDVEKNKDPYLPYIKSHFKDDDILIKLLTDDELMELIKTPTIKSRLKMYGLKPVVLKEIGNKIRYIAIRPKFLQYIDFITF